MKYEPRLIEYRRTILQDNVVDVEISHNSTIDAFMKNVPRVYSSVQRLERELTLNEKQDWFNNVHEEHSLYDMVWITNEEIERCMANDGGFVRCHLIGKEQDVHSVLEKVQHVLDQPVVCGDEFVY